MSKNNPSARLGGQVLYFTRRIDPATGETIISDQPVVTLRNSSLDRIPAAGETWYIKFPVSPVPGAPLQSFVFTPDRAPEHGTDIGFTRIYPERLSQDGEPVS